MTAWPMSAGLLTTWTPAALRAAIFSDAVPLPPAMMASAFHPACSAWHGLTEHETHDTGFLNEA